MSNVSRFGKHKRFDLLQLARQLIHPDSPLCTRIHAYTLRP